MKHFFFLILCLSLFACNTSTDPENKPDPDTKPDTGTTDTKPDKDPDVNVKEFAVLLTVADRLRMRKEPNLKAEIIATLDINTPLIYLNEKTETTEKIKIGTIEHDAPWLRVELKNGDNGWVYGSQKKYGGMVEYIKEVKGPSKERIELVDKFSASKIEGLTGLKGVAKDWDSYAGFYQYKTVDGVKELNGQFEFRACRFIKDYDLWISNKYYGEYTNGYPNGEIKNRLQGVEGHVLTVIIYDGKSYDCSTIYNSWQSEGMHDGTTEENPTDCSFDALDETY